MAADITDKFSKIISGTTRPVATTLSAQKLIGATTASLTAATGWDTDTAVHGIMYRTDAGTGAKVAGSQIDWKATLSGTTLSNFTVTAGTDDTYAIGATVELAPTAAWGDDLVTGLLVEHNQNGTHADVTAESLAVSGATTLTGALTVKSYDGWVNTADTWTYASATTFTIAGVDRTSQFPVGTKIKLTQTTAKYFYVTGSAFGTDTTVTITGGSDYSLANAAITSPALSYDATPQGFPNYFNYTPVLTAVSVNPTLGAASIAEGSFAMRGKTVHATIGIRFGTSGTAAGTGEYRISIPVSAKTTATLVGSQPAGSGRMLDASTNFSGMIFPEIETSSTIQLVYYTGISGTAAANGVTNAAPWAWTVSDIVFAGHVIYEAA